MNLKHKPGFFSRICLILIFLLIAGSFIVSNSPIYADDEKESEVIVTVQSADDEVMTEEMAQKIKDLEVITIDNKGYKKDRKGPAKFEHVKHAREYKISCWECHHEYKEDQQSEQPVAMVEEQVEGANPTEEMVEVEDVVKVEDIADAEDAEYTEDAEDAAQVEEEQTEKDLKSEQPLPKELTAQNIWSPWGITKKCSECHDPQVKKKDVIKLQAAYHKNCKNCHKERRIYGNKILDYRKCTTCHQ